MNQEWVNIIEKELKSYNSKDDSKSVMQALREFGCDSDEIPYFVCKKKSVLTLFKENVYALVTQRGLYYKIKKTSHKISFENLAEIVFYGGSTFCYAYIESKRNDVLDEGFWADLFVSADRLSLITVLQGIQNQLLQESSIYREKRKKYFDAYLNSVENEFNEKYTIDSDASTIMDELLKEDDFKEQILRIKIAREITSLSSKQLNNAIEEFVDSFPIKRDAIIKYVEDHLDKLYEYVHKEIEEKLELDSVDFWFCNAEDFDISNKIESDENLTSKCKEIYPHINFWYKLDTFENVKMVEEYCGKYGVKKREVYLVEWARFVNKNRENSLLLGRYFRDGLGLSSNHYMLIKNDNDGSRINLEKVHDVQLPDNVDHTLDIGLLAAYKNKTIVLEKMFERCPEYKAILKAKESAEKAVKWANLADFGAAVIDLAASTAVSTLQKAESEFNENLDKAESKKNEISKYDYAKRMAAEDTIREKTEEFQSKYEKMENGIYASYAISDTLVSLSDGLKEELDFINEEIDELKKSFIEEYYNDVANFNPNSSPFARMIFDIYDGLDLSGFVYGEYVVTTIEGMTFVIPKELYKKYFEDYYKNTSEENKSENASTDQKQEKQSYSNVKKPYNNSWFSNAAHNDLATMRKEYRELVKKYHPDNFEGPTKYFIEIQEERAKILAEHKFK